MIYLFLVLALIAFSAILIGFAYLWESACNLRPGRVIYASSNLKEQGTYLKQIIEHYIQTSNQKTEKYTLVEVGAGLARVCHFLGKEYRWKEIQAVELGRVILWLGKVRARLVSSAALVRYVNQDMFSYQPPSPSLIYCYITSPMITKLYQTHKLEGSLVVSLTFPIDEVTPTEVVKLSSWQSALYVYDFRLSK